jgi:hypothetical protein
MRRQLIWALLLVVASFGIASAQETTSGTIIGTVVDAQGAPVPGATVTVTSPQGPKMFVTDANGRFFAPYLTPGKYSLKVELSGFSAVEQKNIDVHLGSGSISRTSPSGRRPVGRRGRGRRADGRHVFDHDGRGPRFREPQPLPIGRNFTDTLYLVPGVSDSSGLGKANPSIGGASGLENNYVVDGVNITDSGFGAIGAYNSTYGSLGSGVTTDFIKETQVKTGGFEAEYGQATGGVVNVVTKSGENAFHGSVFGYMRPYGLEVGLEDAPGQNGIVNTVGRQDSDVACRWRAADEGQAVLLRHLQPPVPEPSVHRAGASTLANGTTVVFPSRSQPVTQKRRSTPTPAS